MTGTFGCLFYCEPYMEIKLLRLLAICHVIGGMLLCLLYFSTPLHNTLLDLVYRNQAEKVANASQLMFWLCILGPTIASWGVLFFTLVQQFAQHPSVLLWRGMITAVLVWAPLDSLLCTLNGIYAGAIGNIAMTIVLLVLLFRCKVFIRHPE